jgi:hypothetical protein
MQVEDIALALVHISQELEALTIIGKAGFPQRINLSSLQGNGNRHAVIFGLENEDTVNDAMVIVSEATKFIISNHGQNTNYSGLIDQTWLCSALNVISSFIPKETSIKNTFKFIIDIESDYTKLPGKAPDGPRYKALGNSMAVPVMKWIGERIQMVDDINRGNL